MRGSLLLSSFIALALVACGGAQPTSVTPADGSPGPGATTAPGAAASPATKGAPPARDPQIVALAQPALACKFEEGYFDEECPALKAWHDNEELFAEGKGNDTVFSMLGDPDEKIRVLATDKGIDDSKTYFADKAHATLLFALAKKETNPGVAHEFGGYVAKVDVEKLGLGPELVALAKQPVGKFREALAFYLISTNQSPTAFEALKILLEDADKAVKENAIGSLSTGGITPGVPPVCDLLKKQLVRTDDFAGKALWTGSSSKCPGIDEVVIAELEKRVADPTKVTNAVGIGYSLAAQSVCQRTASADLRKKGFAIGVKLTDARLPDPNTRRAGLSVLTGCDPAGAAKALGPLAKDKDKFVADEAKKELTKLPKK
jgi:hypothetical protein